MSLGIDGGLHDGETLEARYSLSVDSGDAIVRWFRVSDDRAAYVHQGVTYTLGPADVGAHVRLACTPISADGREVRGPGRCACEFLDRDVVFEEVLPNFSLSVWIHRRVRWRW